jgi:aspartate-semialdehyde dehydrogenase
MKPVKVGILGATGVVGQQYLSLLQNHPWFEVSFLAASPRSAGKTYVQAVENRWRMPTEIPEALKNFLVFDANDVESCIGKCKFVFSALEMEKTAIRTLECKYAESGIPVVSNASAHRTTEDVPVLIPEINSEHLEVLSSQKERRNWKNGFIVVKPNCSVQSYMIPVFALINAGYLIDNIIVTTMQAVSGAGYPGVSASDMIANTVPFIPSEEEKSELEPLKILGKLRHGKIQEAEFPKISAHCNRVPVIDGHSACVSIRFANKKPSIEEAAEIFTSFVSIPRKLMLPFSPERPIVLTDMPDRPQPRKDINNCNGMAVTVGRLRKCPVFDIKFVGLSHNTIRGAAGGGILNAELLKAKGFFDF